MTATPDSPPPAEKTIPHTHVAIALPGRGMRNLLRFGGICLVAAAAASLFPPFGTAIYGPPIYPWALGVFILLVMAATAVAGMHGRELASRPERWAIPLAAATSLALFASPFADRAAFSTLALLVLPAGIIVITAWVTSAKDNGVACLNLFRATAAVAIGISVWGLFSWAVVDFATETGAVDLIVQISGVEADYPSLWSIENPHPFGHKNFVAGFALLALPILFVLVCLDRSRVRLVWLTGLPIVVFYLVSSESRAGWLALAAGGAFYLALRFLRARASRQSWWLVPILLVVLAIPFLASPRLRESVQRAGQEESLAAIDPYRWDVFQTGISVGNAYPLTGVGPGVLSLVSPEHSDSEHHPVVYQVHSTPIQLYAETGIAGVLASLVLVWGLFRAWKRRRGNEAASLEDHLKDAAAVALLSYAAFALTDYQLDVPAISLAAAVPAGALLGLGGRSSGPVFRKSWLAAWAVAALLLLPVLWFNGKGLFARLHLKSGITHLDAKNIDAFASDAERAHARAPSDPFYLNQLANVWLTEWVRATDSTQRVRVAENARRVMEQSLEIAPGQDSVHFNLGIILRSQGKLEEALDAFQKALEYNPRKRFAWFLSGKTLLDLNDEDEAAEAFARELLTNPSSRFSPIWKEAEIQPHMEARNQYFERLAETSEVSAAQRYLFYWSIDDPRPFEGDLESQPEGLRVLLMALEGDPEAAVNEAPLTSEAFLVRAWIDSDEAERWLRAAFFQANGSAFSQSNLQLIADPLRKGETFSAGLRAVLHEPGLPATPKQSRPRASGLFERNFYGAPLFDFYVYDEPIVLLLF